MAKVRETRVTERDIADEREKDPIAIAVRAFLNAGDPLPEEIDGYEFSVTAQLLQRNGKPVHGERTETENLREIVNEILDQTGPGRYTVYVNYRPAGSSEKKKFVKIGDMTVVDPEGPPGPPVAGSSALETPQGGRDILSILLAQSQQQFQMMLAQQNAMTQIMVAALGKGNGSGTGDILKAIELGSSLAGGAPADDEQEGGLGPINKMIRFGSDVINLIKSGPKEGAIPKEDLRKLATHAGIDRTVQDQGFEIMEGSES